MLLGQVHVTQAGVTLLLHALLVSFFFFFPATHPSPKGNDFYTSPTLLEDTGLSQAQGVAEKVWKDFAQSAVASVHQAVSASGEQTPDSVPGSLSEALSMPLLLWGC